MSAKKAIVILISALIFIYLSISSPLFAEETTFSLDLQNLPAGVSIHQLDNGLQVLLIENPALPMVGVNVVVKVGSAYETFASSGMSHMLEHLLFNGTTARTQKQLYDDADRIGGYNNANTSEFCTNFMMVTPAENIRTGMEIQADMLFNSTLPEEKFAKEKGIVLEEISRTLADPDAQAERNVASILFSGHALSLPTLGTYSTIQHMSRDAVYAFYKNNYVPNNMILSAIGAFDSQKMLQDIRAIYGGIAPADVERQTLPEWSFGLDSAQLIWPTPGKACHRFYSGDKAMVQLFFPVDGSAQFYELLEVTLEQQSPRLQMAIKEAFPEKVSSLALTTRPSPIAGYVQANIVFSGEVNEAVVQAAMQQIRGLDFSLSPEAVQAEAARRRTAFLRNIEKPHMFGIYNAQAFAVSGIGAVLASYSGDDYFAAAEELTSFALDETPIVIIQHPAAEKQDESAAGLVTKQFDDVPGRPLIVVQNPASNLLAIHYLVKHKAGLESKFGKDAAKILHDCLEQRLESEANKKMSAPFGLAFTLNDNPWIPMDDIYLHPDFSYIRVEGLADDVDGAIRYINDQIKNFAPTEKEFELAVEKMQRSGMMMRGNATKKLFDKTWQGLVYTPSPYTAGKADIAFADLSAFAKEYFKPANMIVSVVSPAEPERIHELFADFRSPVAVEPPVYEETPAQQTESVKKEIPAGGKRAYLFWGFTKEIDPADAAALRALSLVLSDVITFDIREKQGMAYRMSAGVSVARNRALFYINQGARPQNVDHLLAQYPKFFSEKILDSVTDADLQKSINMYLGRMMFRRLSSINRAYYLANSLYFHGDINWDENFLQALKKVTLQDVKAAAKKYMRAEKTIVVVAK